MARTQTTQECITDAYLLATGKATGLDITSTKGVKILALMNYFQHQWAKMMPWYSLRSTFTLAGTVSATDTFALLSTIGEISQQEGDRVVILHADGVTETEFDIVPHNRLNEYAHGACAQVGSSLKFCREFETTDAEFGGTIKVPGYSIPATLDANSDVIQVDDPEWLSTRVAAEFIRNDVTRVQLYGSLVDQANELEAAMKANNDSQIETVYTGGFTPFTGFID